MNDITSKPFSSTNKTTFRIYFKDMDTQQTNLTELQTELKNKVCILYNTELEHILKEFKELFLNITKFIAQIDFFTCNAKNAVEKCYIKPIIVNSEESFINAEKMCPILSTCLICM